MMYNYPFFTFPYFRKYPYYSNYVNHTIKKNNTLNTHFSNHNFKMANPSNENSEFYNNQTNGNYFSSGAFGNKTYNLKDKMEKNIKEKNYQYKEKTGFSFLDNFFNQDDRKEDEKYFEILGIKLYNDDILLLCLIFFLYKEDVKDPYLFITLILLLLS